VNALLLMTTPSACRIGQAYNCHAFVTSFAVVPRRAKKKGPGERGALEVSQSVETVGRQTGGI
jgi:hypothetical protein